MVCLFKEEEMKKIETIGWAGRIVMFFLLIAAAAVMAGCGTTVNVKPEESMSGKEIPKLSFTSISIEVKTEVEDSQEEVQMFKKLLENEFNSRNIAVAESGTDAKMVVAINHLKKVSKTSRFFWGSLSGSAELKAKITITVKNSKSLNFSIDSSARGASSAGDWFTGYGGSTDDLLNRGAKKIIEEIL